MSGHDPEVLKEAVNDPAIWLSMLGMAAPNVLYGDPIYGQRVVARPGQFLAAAGQSYDALRARRQFEGQAGSALGELAGSANPPWADRRMASPEVTSGTGAAMMAPGGAQAIAEEGALAGASMPSLKDQAAWRPKTKNYTQYLSGLQGNQLRAALDPKFEGLYRRGQEDVQGDVERQKMALFNTARERWLTQPEDSDAAEAMRTLVGDLKQAGGGAQAYNLAAAEQGRRSTAWMLRTFGYDPDVAERMSHSPNGVNELERVLNRRQEQINSSAHLAGLVSAGVPENELGPIREIVMRGGTIRPEWFQDRLSATQITKAMADFPKVWETLTKGIPVPEQTLAMILPQLNEKYPMAAQVLSKMNAEVTDKFRTFKLHEGQAAEYVRSNKERESISRQQISMQEIGVSLNEVTRLEAALAQLRTTPALSDVEYERQKKDGKTPPYISAKTKAAQEEMLTGALTRANQHYERSMLRHSVAYDKPGVYYASRESYEAMLQQATNPKLPPEAQLRALMQFELALKNGRIYSNQIPGANDLIADYESKINAARQQVAKSVQSQMMPPSSIYGPPSPPTPLQDRGAPAAPPAQRPPGPWREVPRPFDNWMQGQLDEIGSVGRAVGNRFMDEKTPIARAGQQANERLDAIARKRFGRPYSQLNQPEQDVVRQDFGVPGYDPSLPLPRPSGAP